MSAAPRLRGQGNGRGRVVGPAHVADRPARIVGGETSTAITARRLRQAISQSVAALAELAASVEERSAGILEFQIEMLTDPAICEMAFAAIERGQAVELSWVSALEGYIAGFEESDDEEIRARAVDVIDIRDRVLRALAGVMSVDFPAGSIFVGRDMPPSLFLAHDWSNGGGIALEAGSMASHVAMLARASDVPMVIGLGEMTLKSATPLLLDAVEGVLVVEPSSEDDMSVEHAIERRDALPGPSAGPGAMPVEIFANLNSLADLDRLVTGGWAGIGLVRTEFVFPGAAERASEDRQLQAYRRMLQWADGRTVNIRLLDLGGDKPQGEGDLDDRNPFLGLRGIRLLLAKPDLLRIQARALLRAGAFGPLRVLLPVVTVPDEVLQVRRIFEEEAAALVRRHVSVRMPAIGIMVEVPAAALMLDGFGAADFFSMGTNDLAQYLMAAARDNSAVADLYSEAWPLLLRLVRQCVDTAERLGKPISICGDIAGDPAMLPLLVEAGIRQISIAPHHLATLRTAGVRAAEEG